MVKKTTLRMDVGGSVMKQRKTETAVLLEALEIISSKTGLGFPTLVVVKGPDGSGKDAFIQSIIAEQRQKQQEHRSKSKVLLYRSARVSLVSQPQENDRHAYPEVSSSSSSPLEILQQLVSGLADSVLDLDDVDVLQALQLKFRDLDNKQQQVLHSLLHSHSSTRARETLLGLSGPVVASDHKKRRESTSLIQFRTFLKQSIRSFLRIIVDVIQSPIVMVLQDMLHADQLILEVFQFILTDEALSKVLCCATLEVQQERATADDDQLVRIMEWLKEIERIQGTKLLSCPSKVEDAREEAINTSTTTITTISLKSFNLEQIAELLLTCMKRYDDKDEEILKIAQLVHQRTQGNVFYVSELLEYWQNRKWITNPVMGGTWDCTISLEEMENNTPVSDNVADLICARLETTLPLEVQHTLQLASVFHDPSLSIDSRLLEIIIHNSLKNNDSTLTNILTTKQQEKDDENYWWQTGINVACDETILLRLSEQDYKFSSEKLKSAAYKRLLTSCSMSDPKPIHFEIGKILLNNLGDDKKLIDACADQLLHGLDSTSLHHAIKDGEEQKIAQLFLLAGNQAAGDMANEKASKYYEMGALVLDAEKMDVMHRDHNLAMELQTLFADTELRCGRMTTSKKAAEFVVNCNEGVHDKIPAMMILLQCSHTDERFDSVITIGNELLKILGEPCIPVKPNRFHLRWEVQRAMKALRTGNFYTEEVSRMPKMDKHQTRIMNILHSILSPALLSSENHKFFIIAASRMVCLTTTLGVCEWSAAGLSSFALCLLGYMSQAKEAIQMAELSLRVFEETPSAEAGTCTLLCGLIRSIEPSRKFLDSMKQGYLISMEQGLVSEAFASLTYGSWLKFYDGAPIQPLLEEMEQYMPTMLEYKQLPSFLLNIPTWQTLLNLTGKVSDMENGGAMALQEKIGGNPQKLGRDFLLNFSMQIAFYMGDGEKAWKLKEEINDEAGKLIAKHCPFVQARTFFYCLVCIDRFRACGKRKYLSEARGYYRHMKNLCKKGFIKFVHKVQIVEAELHGLNSSQNVLREYDTAIVSSFRSGYPQDGALANYLAAQYCLRSLPSLSSADMYLEKSHEMYLSWGASRVASSIVERHPDFFKN